MSPLMTSNVAQNPSTPSPRDASTTSSDDSSPHRASDLATRFGLDVFGQPESPSTSIMLTRTAETLHGLSQQLADLNVMAESDPSLSLRCCCGAKADCPSSAARERKEAKLKLSGEIGQALLQRYEALERKYKRLEHNFELQRKALADSLRHVANLERANNTHMSKYADLTHSYEALEKRYVQVTHSQSLTQQSLSHVRSELAKCRQTANAQTIALAASGGIEQRLAEAERRYEDTRDLQQAESRKLNDQLKWRKMAEDRIADLESQLTASGREIEEIRAARQKDAQELLANAKERLETLHSELSDTFQTSSPSDTPEYQRTLEDLVATNTLLKHDTSELAHTLSQTLDENRALRDELEELRSARPPRSSRPLSMEIRPMMTLTKGHMRTGSIPATSAERAHTRVSSAIVSETNWSHFRRSSVAPSFTSTSTTDGPSIASPGNAYEHSSSSSPRNRDDRPMSPDQRVNSSGRHRSSVSSLGGIPYISNGVAKTKGPRPLSLRSNSDRRNLPKRSMGVSEAINEWPADDENLNGATSGEEPTSPDHDDTFRGAGASRKRTSVLLPRVTSPASHYDSNSSGNGASPSEKSAESSALDHKRISRRTLLLLSRSTGVQTEPIEEKVFPQPRPQRRPSHQSDPSVSLPGTPALHGSETSSVGGDPFDRRGGMPQLTELLDYLSKMLVRLRGIDIATLNRRLKKQHLPGDVSHLSKTTLGTLQTEVTELRHRFRSLLDVSDVSRREMSLLLKLLKDVFSDILELQNVVNAVTIDPKLAKKLRREAFHDPDAPPETTSGLGWIAGPLTSLFAAVPQKTTDTAAAVPSRDRVITPPAPPTPARPAPKQQALTSATTTHISVEFGSTGNIRRTLPTQAQASITVGAEPAHVASRSVSAPVAAGSARVRSRASRSDLMGIFAGAQPSGVPPAVRARVRHASSQYFGPTDRRIFSEPRERLSTIVDAVLDPGDGEDDVIPGDYEPPLLERTLRPRGLSDSSIRSATVMDTGVPPNAPETPVGSGTTQQSSLGLLSRSLNKIGEAVLSSSSVNATTGTAQDAQAKSTQHLGLGQPRRPPLESTPSASSRDSTPALSIPIKTPTAPSTAAAGSASSPGVLKRTLDDEDHHVLHGVLLSSGAFGTPMTASISKTAKWGM